MITFNVLSAIIMLLIAWGTTRQVGPTLFVATGAAVFTWAHWRYRLTRVTPTQAFLGMISVAGVMMGTWYLYRAFSGALAQ